MTALTPAEARALASAVGFMTAGPADGVSQRAVKAAERGAIKLCAEPDHVVWVPFSKHELELLWAAVNNGAEAVLQRSSPYRPMSKKSFKKAANKIADAFGSYDPRF